MSSLPVVITQDEDIGLTIDKKNTHDNEDQEEIVAFGTHQEVKNTIKKLSKSKFNKTYLYKTLDENPKVLTNFEFKEKIKASKIKSSPKKPKKTTQKSLITDYFSAKTKK